MNTGKKMLMIFSNICVKVYVIYSIFNFNNFRLMGELGTGSFSVVRLCEQKTSRVQYAVKIMDKLQYDPREEIEILLR